ncbi:MAG TPA: TolC family protein, partial [Bradyrhizobium sp.]|nr:TolC family protein [Bradyrhizobium sp.]
MRRRAGETADSGALAATSRLDRAARWLTALGILATSAGCILTSDLPNPALDVPQGYKAGKPSDADTPPALDWWRGFGSPELTDLMEEAQKVNLDIAAAVAVIAQADAQARIAGAALLPTLMASGPGNLGQESYSRVSGSSLNGLSTGGREVVNYSTSLSASYIVDFWGQYRDAAQAAEETAVADRFNRQVVALTTLTAVATAYFQVLASQDRLRTAARNIDSAARVLDAIRERQKAGTGTDLDVAQQESVLA